MLARSEHDYARLQNDFIVLRRKYGMLKVTLQETFFDHLPKTSPEFKPLCVQSGACSTVEYESDSRIDQIDVVYLGQGRFGTVFHGQTEGPGGSVAQVAMKKVPKAAVRSLISLRNLANEIACMRHLTHAKTTAAPGSAEALELEHIVTLHSVRTSNSSVYLEQSFGGSDLFSVVSRCSRDVAPLPTVVMAAVARGLMMGVAAMHRQNWCHRDIKSENILLGVSAKQLLSMPNANDAAAAVHVQLCDFGVCASLRGPPLRQFCGSPGFFAPELADMMRGTQHSTVSVTCSVDGDASPFYDGAAADVFSLGAALYEMLVGTKRFTKTWASAYVDYAVRDRRDLERSLTDARNVAAAELQVADAADVDDMSTTATAGGAIGLPQLNALALGCLALDPRARPTSDAIVATMVHPAAPTEVAARGGGDGGGGGLFPRRRRHYPRDAEGGDVSPLFAARPQPPAPRKSLPLCLDDQRPAEKSHDNGAALPGSIASPPLPSVRHVRLD